MIYRVPSFSKRVKLVDLDVGLTPSTHQHRVILHPSLLLMKEEGRKIGKTPFGAQKHV